MISVYTLYVRIFLISNNLKPVALKTSITHTDECLIGIFPLSTTNILLSVVLNRLKSRLHQFNNIWQHFTIYNMYNMFCSNLLPTCLTFITFLLHKPPNFVKSTVLSNSPIYIRLLIQPPSIDVVSACSNSFWDFDQNIFPSPQFSIKRCIKIYITQRVASAN